MRRITLLFVWTVFFVIFFQESASPFWLWSPKKSTFTQPKKIGKQTPKEQLEWALSLYEAKDYPRALQEMETLVRRFPRSAEAAEGQFYLGRCQEMLENYDAAVKAYEGVIKKYPNNLRIQEMIEQEYRIANLYFSGKKRKIPGLGLEILPSYAKAIEIYKQIVVHAPYGSYGELSQYKIGESYKKIGEYRLSREAFEEFLEDYPKSELVDDAKYQIALVTFKMARGASYDAETTDKAIAEFSKFIEEHPESELAQESQEAIRELKDRKAEKAFEIAEFYAKQEQWAAAKVYYNQVIEQFADSRWAGLALEKVTVLEKAGKKK